MHQAKAIVPRGAGRSYGDAALNHRGLLCATEQLRVEPLQFDAATGILRCSAATTQREVLEVVCPQGWVLPAIPGSREITLGGSIAADAHGKNHYAAGSTIQHVRQLTLLLPDGSLVECSRQANPDLFWTTAGGLGLTGLIVAVELQLRRIASTTVRSQMLGFTGVEHLLEVIEQHKDSYEYILGWANGNFKPGQVLTGVVALGQHVSAQELAEPWAFPVLTTYRLPFPNFLPGAGWQAAHILNAAIGRKFVAGKMESKNINQFFFPQDVITNWNVAFGFKGFVEYHCCLPLATAKDGLTDIHHFLCQERMLCSLVAIKRFGAAVEEAPLSFPLEGYSLALDIPVRDNVVEKLKTLDQILLCYGGRVNPVKDSRLAADMLGAMYPKLAEWLKVKRSIDPHKKISSNMSRRLELDG